MSRRAVLVVLGFVVVGWFGWNRWRARSIYDADADHDYDYDLAAEQQGIGPLVSYLKEHPGNPRAKDARAELGRRFAAARAHLGGRSPATAALLGWLAAHDTNVVPVRFAPPDAAGLAEIDAALARMATPGAPIAPIAPHFGPDRAVDLEHRFEAALGHRFEAALGVDAVAFGDAAAGAPAGGPVLEVGWKVRGSDRVFHSAMNKRQFVGIAMDFDVTLRVPGADPIGFHAAVAPPDEFKAATDLPGLTMQYPTSNVDDANIYGGMAEAAFGSLADQLLGTLSVATPGAPTASPLDRARRWCEDQHDGPSCVELARAYLAGDGVPADKARAAELLRDPCLLGTGRACVLLARLELTGDGVPKNAVRAALDAEHGCDDHDGEACRLHAQILARTGDVAPMLDDHEPARPERALAYFVEACDLRDADGCREAAARFEHGTGAPRSAAAAAVLARRACAAEAGAAGREAGSCPDADRLDTLAARAPTRRVLDVALPEGAAIFDVRYQMPYESDPMVTVWVATRLQRDELYAELARGHAHASVDVEDTSDAARPATAPPPDWAVTIFGVHRAGTSPACPPCRRGLPVRADNVFCDCPP